MVTYENLFAFVIMLCAVITLVTYIQRKKQRPRPSKIRRYFLQQLLPAARLYLAFGSLVKYIIANYRVLSNCKTARAGNAGGRKTENGNNRFIPLCDKILPLIRSRYNPDKKYLTNNKYGNYYTYETYQNENWNTVMNKLGFQHSPHDGRYTFASLADNAGMNPVCLKIIIGHAVFDNEKHNFKTRTGLDITKGVYTQKTMEKLLVEVNKLQFLSPTCNLRSPANPFLLLFHEYSDNRKPRNHHGFGGQSHFLYNALCLHSLSNLQEARNVCACHVVAFHVILLGRLV